MTVRHVEEIPGRDSNGALVPYWNGLNITGSISGPKWIESTLFDCLLITVVWNVNVGINGVIRLRGTNDDSLTLANSDHIPPLASELSTTAAGITIAGAGVTFTAVAAAGALNLMYDRSLPKWLRLEWAFGSGGGGANALSAWVVGRGLR